MISIRQLLNTAPKDGTYIEVFIMTPPYAVIRNVYWCQDAADWAEGGRIFKRGKTALWLSFLFSGLFFCLTSLCYLLLHATMV